MASPDSRRRVLLAALALAPLAPHAQSARARVALVTTGEAESVASLARRVEQGLQAAGVRAEVLAFRADDPEASLTRAAADAVRAAPDLLITAGPIASVAVAKATSTIPIVFFAVSDPVGFNLVRSLARPGTNATGAANHASTITLKRMELVRELLPKARRVTALTRRRGSANVAYLDGIRAQVRDIGAAAGLQVEEVDVGDVGLQATLDGLARRPAEAMVGFGPYAWEPAHQAGGDALAALVAFERQTRCVVVHDTPHALKMGATVAMYDTGSQVRTAVEIAARVLRGAAPGELPVQTGTTYSLAVNPDAARAIGLAVPASIALRAEVVRP